MASPGGSASFEASFQVLVKYLQQNLSSSGKESLKIPEHMIAPFKRVLQPQPTDSSLVRPLLKLFDGSNYRRADRLDPLFFSGLVSIVFYLPYSLAQEKLLYAFMESINAPQSLDRDERNQAIAKRLLHVLLKRLVGIAVDKRLRWVAAQLIASLLDSASSSDRLDTYPEFQHLQTLLTSHEDYVTRFLIADLVRLRCLHGAVIDQFFPPGTATQTILGFPRSENRDVAWLRKLQDFFFDLDATTSFTGSRQAAFRVLDVNYDNQQQSRLDGSVAIITDRITFLSASGDSCLHLASIPLLGSSETSAVIAKDNPTVLEIGYAGDSGYQVRNGTKRALCNVSLCLSSEDDAAAALDVILDAQELGHVPLEPPAATTPAPQTHRSIAFLNLWTAEIDSGESDAATKETQMLPTSNEVPSPLQHMSQRCPEGGNGKPSAVDDDTASESSFLEGQRDKRSLGQKFNTAQDSIEQGSKAQAFTKAADSAVGRSRSRSRIRPEAGTKTVEGAVEIPPHLPSKRVTASRPLVPIFEEAILPVAKGPRADSESAFDPAPLPPVLAQKPQLPERRPLAKKTNNQKTRPIDPPSAGKIVSGGPPPAKKIVGPMARLSKNNSQSTIGLKRKAQPAGKTYAVQEIAGDESFRDEASFDLPEDSSHDERPKKKSKTQERKTAGKKQATTKQKTRPAKSGKQAKPSKPPTKKALSKPAARLSTENVILAATRPRRTTNKAATYEESSPSDNDPVSDNQRRTAPDVSLPKAPASKEIRKHALLQRDEDAESSPLHHDSPAQESTDNDMAPRQGSPPSKDAGQAAREIPGKNHEVDVDDMNVPQPELGDDEEEGIAQDSYPTAVLTEQSTSKTRTSFGTSLTTMLHAPSAKKGNGTHRPITPFGNKSQFVKSVNAAKSHSPTVPLSLKPKPLAEAQVTNSAELDKATTQAVERPVLISNSEAARGGGNVTLRKEKQGQVRIPSDSSAKKPSLIHFNHGGPVNQGVSPRKENHQTLAASGGKNSPPSADHDVVIYPTEADETTGIAQPPSVQVPQMEDDTFLPADSHPSQRSEEHLQPTKIDLLHGTEDEVDQPTEDEPEQINDDVNIIQPTDDNPAQPAETAYAGVADKSLDPPSASGIETSATDVNPVGVAGDTLSQQDPQKIIRDMQMPAQHSAHSRTSSTLFPAGEASETQLQPQPPTRPDDDSLQSLELLAGSALSENDEGTYSEYEESEDEGALQSQDNSESILPSAVLPAASITDPAAPVTATRRRSSPDLEDEETSKPAVKSQAHVLKLSSRMSIGLTALTEKNFPEAELTILPVQTKPMKPRVSKRESTVAQIASPPPVNPTDMTVTQALMPPPKRVTSVNRAPREPQSSRSRPEPERRSSTSPALPAVLAPTTDVPERLQPLRLRPTDLSPIRTVEQAFEHSPTLVPLHLRFEQHLKNIVADLEGNRSEAPQRTSYATEDSADPTLVARRSSNQYFRRRVRSISLSSNESMTSSCRGEEPLTRDDADSNSFLGLQKSIHDIFWQVAEECLFCLRTEQGIIEKEVESFETASQGASVDMQTLWAKKIGHEGLKVREQLDHNSMQLEDAAERMAEEKDWWNMLRAEDMEAEVKRRGVVTMHALQILQKSIMI